MNHEWGNSQTGLETQMPLMNDGHVRIFQKKIGTTEEELTGKIIANYHYRETLLTHCTLFFLQTGQPVPYRHNWNQEFYGGSFKRLESLSSSNINLKRITRQTKKGALITIPKLESKPEHNPALNIKDEITMGVVRPTIHKGNLIYPIEPKNITLASQDVWQMHQALIDQMLKGTRRQKNQPGVFYSFFPFKAYES
ncbi:hypothetical protein CMI37_37875 [Candidatus Pacearchaeota archaeon]|nr:hypothetical protein [Candidatus Pacearchaeota archaeon]|tara:strand:- start:1687 stop:2274 length:588 start_codon:yes stop_codon:yes gene_type:complete